MKNVLISIIIPTYKRSENLVRSIESILTQEQKYEIIIVDDNDEDTIYRKNNEKLLEKYIKNNNLIYLKHKKNKNGAAARNTGIKVARGKYITFLDDDDEFMPERIKKIETLANSENPDVIFTGVLHKYKGLEKKITVPNINNKSIKELQIDLLEQKSFFGTGSNMICKREIVNYIGGFDERFIRHQDMEFMIRVLENSKLISVIPEPLVIKNEDDINNIPNFENMLKMKKLYLTKFENIINECSPKVVNQIYRNNYYELLTNAYLHKNKNDIKQAKNMLRKKNIFDFKKVMLIKLKIKLKSIYIIRKLRSIIKK